MGDGANPPGSLQWGPYMRPGRTGSGSVGFSCRDSECQEEVRL